MINYPDFISKKRIPVKPPYSVVDKEGKFNLGTFSEPFESLNMLDAYQPLGFPMAKWFKKLRLKDWEAVEVAFDEGFLVSAVYSFGFIGFNIIIFHEYETRKNYVWQDFALPGSIKNHETLTNSVKSLDVKGKHKLEIINNFNEGKATYKATAKNKTAGEVESMVELVSVSTPSNVCIPFGKNRALYSHKEFFKAEGYLKINGKEYKANEKTVAIIDDHKGYYPRDMKYYWITGMATKDFDGVPTKIAFNLTENQSIDSYNYNENLLWLEGVSYPLPPVHFELVEKDLWHVKDEHGMVDIKFFIQGDFTMVLNVLGLIKADYRAPFGRYEGFIKDYEGKTYDVSGLYSMGEDKHYVM